MPELPEVEVAARQLSRWLRNKRIVEARAARTRVIRGQAPRRFASLAGHVLKRIERRGKWMLLEFDEGEGLVSHLGMTGKWIRRRKTAPEAPHTRATLELENGFAVDYRDPRLFGRLVRGRVDALRALPSIAEMGPEPLDGVDAADLFARLHRTSRSLKEALMDQRTIAGLGNIYVSEALHRAGLNPERKGSSLREDEAARLAKAIPEALRASIALEDGAEPIVYVEEGGENHFLVYDRAGEPCQNCGTPIERIVQGGRSTFFCPHCQPSRPRRA